MGSEAWLAADARFLRRVRGFPVRGLAASPKT
jgi:hypothetical protein